MLYWKINNKNKQIKSVQWLSAHKQVETSNSELSQDNISKLPATIKLLQRSPLNSNLRGPTKFVLIMNYE